MLTAAKKVQAFLLAFFFLSIDLPPVIEVQSFPLNCGYYTKGLVAYFVLSIINLFYLCLAPPTFFGEQVVLPSNSYCQQFPGWTVENLCSVTSYLFQSVVPLEGRTARLLASKSAVVSCKIDRTLIAPDTFALSSSTCLWQHFTAQGCAVWRGLANTLFTVGCRSACIFALSFFTVLKWKFVTPFDCESTSSARGYAEIHSITMTPSDKLPSCLWSIT